MRNREPILEVLRDWLPTHGRVLEVASGTGEHAVHFASGLPSQTWQPSDPSETACASIAAWQRQAESPNLLSPLTLDVRQRPWPVPGVVAVVCINMLHIAPWEATEALLAGAGETLPEGGVLYLYGPFRRDGKHTAGSNAAFDADLRRRDPEWGIRDLESVISLAERHGLGLVAVVDMPANNFSVVLRAGASQG